MSAPWSGSLLLALANRRICLRCVAQGSHKSLFGQEAVNPFKTHTHLWVRFSWALLIILSMNRLEATDPQNTNLYLGLLFGLNTHVEERWRRLLTCRSPQQGPLIEVEFVSREDKFSCDCTGC